MVTNNSGSTKGSKNSGGGPNTGLIAGLTTGLVCAALIALTAGLLIYRKRKRAQMADINRKPASLESPPAPHSEIIMAAPASSNIKVPPAPEPATLPPPAPAPVLAPVATSTPDHYQENSLYIGSPLFIPPLSATTSTINKSNANETKAASIQRSLTLSSRPQYDPSKTLARSNISATKNSNLSSPLNRSSSVKVTKYDYNPPILDDDDLDHVQIRRAISVKRRNAAAHSTYLAQATPLVSVSRSTSLRSQTAKSHLFDDGSNSDKTLPTTTTPTTSVNVDKLEDGNGNNCNNEDNNENKNDDDDDAEDDDGDSLDETTTSASTKSGAVQVVCAKPTIARIRSISRKDSTGKKTTKVVEDHSQQPIKTSQHVTPDDSSSSHLTPHQPKPLERMSMRSMPDSTHSSTLADGEITVYWQHPSDQ
ncbi:hypothetical protein BCR42DRAFT_449745 [Absidia repens]|uniref:Uncharacterized protein n=1 Tax=Absidia repens TaxID=90262 RepID=A0A1X2IMT9_9FUNG|nr:hypothetical protein BCR42DRAFT_449745 [Absidia repens]